MVAASGKDTIYVDVDDEITNIIDKVKTSPHKIVALVLPKRSAVLQSVVNMKLLKRAAATHKKNIVLITSEAGLLPLAGVAGIHVANSLNTKPEIPALPDSPLDDDAEIVVSDDDNPIIDKKASVGTLAAAAAVKAAKDDDGDESEVIELDNVNPEPAPSIKETAKAIKKKHLRVPNFDRFRMGILIACGAGILLIVFMVLAGVVWPHATVTISTNTSTVDAQTDFTVSTDQKTLDVNGKKVPATYKEIKKTDTQKIQATGQKNNGAKATGTMTLKNCSTSDDPVTIPAGTAFSSNSLTFVSDAAIVLPQTQLSGGSHTCTTATQTVGVTAQNGGANYNLSARTYNVSISGIQASGSTMAGGTDDIVKIVSQSDLDGAAETMKGRLDTSAYTSLTAQFEKDSLYSLDATKVAGSQTITSSPALGEVATGDVTVTAVTTYSMLGVHKDDLSQLVKKEAGTKIDTKKQAITNDGMKSATIILNSLGADNKSAVLNIDSTVTAGPEIDQDAIKELSKGKKKGDIEKTINALPGVTEVEVKYSPFWVLSTPRSAKKITVVVKKATDTQVNDSSGQGL